MFTNASEYPKNSKGTREREKSADIDDDAMTETTRVALANEYDVHTGG